MCLGCSSSVLICLVKSKKPNYQEGNITSTRIWATVWEVEKTNLKEVFRLD